MKSRFVSVTLLCLLSGCVEDSLVLLLPDGAHVDVTLGRATCWYTRTGALAPMSIDVRVNPTSRQATVTVSDVSHVRGATGSSPVGPVVMCSTQAIMSGTFYRLPGPGETVDQGFVTMGIYDVTATSYGMWVNEHYLHGNGSSTQLYTMSWVDASMGFSRLTRPLNPAGM